MNELATLFAIGFFLCVCMIALLLYAFLHLKKEREKDRSLRLFAEEAFSECVALLREKAENPAPPSLRTGNLITDTLLDTLPSGITLRTEGRLPEKLHANSALYALLLDGMLREAVQRSKETKNPEISLKTKLALGNLFLEIRFPHIGEKMGDGREFSRRWRSLQELLREGNGSLEYSWTDESFTFQLLVYQAGE